MGAFHDCCRRSNTNENAYSGTGITPSTEARRQAAAAAATQRLQQLETRGVDQDEYRRLNQRRIEQERIEQQMKAQKQNNNNDGGLRWQMN